MKFIHFGILNNPKEKEEDIKVYECPLCNEPLVSELKFDELLKDFIGHVIQGGFFIECKWCGGRIDVLKKK